MGPPKRRPRKTPYSEIKRRYDYFEYRWDTSNGAYYLFNPWTGETIFSTNLQVLNRQKSMWAKAEKYPTNSARFIQLHPEFYMSKQWGRRKFAPFVSSDRAAIVIQAVARGFLVRLKLRYYYRSRFYTMADPFSGYLYYVDRENLDAETRWYKPRLAFADDIQPLAVEDPDDYMKGQRFSKQDFKVGPLIKVAGLSKVEQDRADIEVFIVKNELRTIACRRYSDIDLEQFNFHDLVLWMDGAKLTSINLNEYHFMRTAVEGGDWHSLLHYMTAFPDNTLVQLFGFLGFAKTDVPLESPLQIDQDAHRAIEKCVDVIQDRKGNQPLMLKKAAMNALHSIFSVRAGRLDFLSTDSVVEQGEHRQVAMEAYLRNKLSIFNKFLSTIPNETVMVYERGSDVPNPVVRPLASAIEMVECVFKCLCLLAQEQEIREQLALIILRPVLFAFNICEDESYVVMNGLQLLYNLCYRCESGQEIVLLCIGDPDEFLEKVRYKHSADQIVCYQAHRLELALRKNGWCGYVEEIISREMKNEDIEEEYHQISNHQQSKSSTSKDHPTPHK